MAPRWHASTVCMAFLPILIMLGICKIKNKTCMDWVWLYLVTPGRKFCYECLAEICSLPLSEFRTDAGSAKFS